MITTEQAFDMLPHAVGIYEKLDLKAVGERITQQVRKEQPGITAGELQSAVGEKVIIHIVKETQKIKPEFFAIVAIASGVSVTEAKVRPILQSIQTFKEVFMDKELWAFFKQAMQ